MKTWKLVSGIISIVLFAIVIFQSCAAGLGNALSQNNEVSGSAGAFLAILMMVGGIVSIAVRNSTGNGGNIALIIIYGLAAITGFSGAGSFTDLNVWAGWCLICGVLAFISMFLKKKW